jgi:DNA (cytosine-5)-methyltransferase 1
MRFLSVCSGIEAASVAWNPLGWKAAAFSEIEPFPCAVLAHHYPTVPNWGDMTKFKEWPDATVDLLCGGTPCQSFSVAGTRKGLDDPRGNLMLTFGAIAARYRPEWLVWENVPGVLSSGKGRDFGAFLGLLGFLGYGFAYRVLDAQFFGLAQRRKRVFVVGCLGSWQRAAAVLSERHCLQGHPAPSRQAGQGSSYGFAGGAGDGIAKPLGAHALSKGRGTDLDNTTYVAADCFNGSLTGDLAATMGTRGSSSNASGPTVLAFDTTQMTSAANRSQPKPGDPCHPRAAGAHAPAIAFSCKDHGADATDDLAPTLRAMAHSGSHANAGGQMAVALNWQAGGTQTSLGTGHDTAGSLIKNQTPGTMVGGSVRRLTPRECERLQGFPDDYTLIPYRGKPAADGPRYKALGNSWAVPCARWIGERIEAVREVSERESADENAAA